MATSPTQRTLAALRKEGYTCAVTEHWNQFSRRRVDLLGFIDIVALGAGIIGVQCTSSTNLASRVTKILTERRTEALAWVRAGGEIRVIGWRKGGKRGERKTWKATCRVITIEELTEAPHG